VFFLNPVNNEIQACYSSEYFSIIMNRTTGLTVSISNVTYSCWHCTTNARLQVICPGIYSGVTNKLSKLQVQTFLSTLAHSILGWFNSGSNLLRLFYQTYSKWKVAWWRSDCRNCKSLYLKPIKEDSFCNYMSIKIRIRQPRSTFPSMLLWLWSW